MTEVENNDIALAVKGLHVGYQLKRENLVVLRGLNLDLKHGELVCFMGPNGVGKSTLLRTIAGVQQPLSGTVEIEEKPLKNFSAAELATKISLVLTDRINAGNMTARELIGLGRYPYLNWSVKFKDDDLIKIEQSIALSEVGAYAHKKIYELSDGQMQKVMIARALCQDTSILILDEPTAHLDLNNRVAIINLLKNLTRQTGKAVLMATHELDLALQAADKLWLAGFNVPVVSGFPEDLVLNGAIDRVFELKGFDLKTGQLEKKSLGKKVALKGSGHEYLWTKNALERNGYEVSDEADYRIHILTSENTISWEIESEGVVATNTLEDLVSYLNNEIVEVV
ncbi:ATP-binding protein of ferrichrome ABC transporter [Fulvivirga imtechensis AK7]|uniref:ATP-binding protein of ferrichrome ABC transporter n=1 Tax=Fulvivirga imtechensis AK7 TaxID=1237149 RepID=L8JMI3_9BACT|nr:ABC transporter ATP-binding protein [Fulvivirga imtechensis]ELR70126.1 ATP-binding protein of ferrichrome ABC transporter [Fulvivirga imtechensis AK7]